MTTPIDKTRHIHLAMMQRCYSNEWHDYKFYGGRGITVCTRWNTHQNPRGVGFQNFLTDMGTQPEGLTLDREDRNGNYEPSNCRWVTKEVQQENKDLRRGTKRVYHPETGELVIASDLAKELGLSYRALRMKLVYHGLWPREDGKVCSLEGCERPLHAVGLCGFHHRRLQDA